MDINGVNLQLKPLILSFDVEEHHRIEAASGVTLGPILKAVYSDRVVPATEWILNVLERGGHHATFFIVGELARAKPGLVRSIYRAGHEVASHGWDHRRVLVMNRGEFREDVRKSKDILEQITGSAVLGYRAPTFSIVRRTAWALDELAELGLLYDSSIYPVRHDRYGLPGAPRGPFLAQGIDHRILEIPPATLRFMDAVLPVGGGGYFRLLPRWFLDRALDQAGRECRPAVTMLYFHPWEFDRDQPRLPLGPIGNIRTYRGIRGNRDRFESLVDRVCSVRAIDVARKLDEIRDELPFFEAAQRDSGQARCHR